MGAKLQTSATSITAINTDGKKVIAALNVFLRQIDTQTLIDLSGAIEKDPGLIKTAMEFKGFIGI